mmetsp:Transcript_36146/g.59570  ORF Transcript_36146/g.59570 Transcript_36146/m.59570 type:complete len:227 (-) Transcript_36146:392-1072(-)
MRFYYTPITTVTEGDTEQGFPDMYEVAGVSQQRRNKISGTFVFVLLSLACFAYIVSTPANDFSSKLEDQSRFAQFDLVDALVETRKVERPNPSIDPTLTSHLERLQSSGDGTLLLEEITRRSERVDDGSNKQDSPPPAEEEFTARQVERLEEYGPFFEAVQEGGLDDLRLELLQVTAEDEHPDENHHDSMALKTNLAVAHRGVSQTEEASILSPRKSEPNKNKKDK